MRVLETINEALRQGGDKSSGGTHTTLIIVLCVVFLLTITIFVFVFARVLVARRAARQAGRGDASGHVASDPARDRLVFAYFPTQAPAVVRMQRLAQTAGLSVQELSEVAPIVPFQKKEGGEEENTCSVCLDEMEAGSKTRRMPCGHDFDAKYVPTSQNLIVVVCHSALPYHLLTLLFVFVPIISLVDALRSGPQKPTDVQCAT